MISVNPERDATTVSGLHSNIDTLQACMRQTNSEMFGGSIMFEILSVPSLHTGSCDSKFASQFLLPNSL